MLSCAAGRRCAHSSISAATTSRLTSASHAAPLYPSVRQKVTDYPRSLAQWAGTTDEARLSDDETARAAYWDSFRQAIRQAEQQQQQQQVAEDVASAAAANASEVVASAASAGSGGGGGSMTARPLDKCRSQARYGSGPDTVRMGKEYTAAELMPVIPEVFGGHVALGA